MRKWARVSKSSRTGFMEALCGDAPTGVTRAKEALRRSPRDPRRYLLLNLPTWARFAGLENLQQWSLRGRSSPSGRASHRSTCAWHWRSLGCATCPGARCLFARAGAGLRLRAEPSGRRLVRQLSALPLARRPLHPHRGRLGCGLKGGPPDSHRGPADWARGCASKAPRPPGPPSMSTPSCSLA